MKTDLQELKSHGPGHPFPPDVVTVSILQSHDLLISYFLH